MNQGCALTGTADSLAESSESNGKSPVQSQWTLGKNELQDFSLKRTQVFIHSDGGGSPSQRTSYLEKEGSIFCCYFPSIQSSVENKMMPDSSKGRALSVGFFVLRSGQVLSQVNVKGMTQDFVFTLQMDAEAEDKTLRTRAKGTKVKIEP
ncbi:hypothetical protein E5288_WYG008043 [Bos mutus]|uniref:Uncharacterized protein n=1 Tax=Bos mutus TaxID=72004 RepID=A0A6B0RTE9_9CETA|nr:hypothetical protein [Bos mutus]